MKKWLLIPLTALVLTACQQVSTTGGGTLGVDRKQTMTSLVSQQQVEQMSAQSYAEETQKARQAGKLNTDAAMTARVRAIAQRLIPQTAIYRADATRWNWEVNVEQSNELNAYCMAGGKIMFYSGLITKLKLTDDEIAQIMGHEIAHALREHARERLSQVYSKQLALQGVSILTGGAYDGYLGLADQAGEIMLTLPNSRTHEKEADVIGLELAARAGYNPNAAITLWQKMSSAGGGGTPEFLSTHPSDTTRISELQARIPAVMPLYQAAAKPAKPKSK
ncbi:M48 family metallopeptidase [Chitinibacteraceae bacterium HSL-7]